MAKKKRHHPVTRQLLGHAYSHPKYYVYYGPPRSNPNDPDNDGDNDTSGGTDTDGDHA